MASGRLRIGYASPGAKSMLAEYGQYNIAGQQALLTSSAVIPQITGLPFSDGFESGNTSAWNTTAGTVTVTTAEAYGGTRSASTLAINGQQSDNYLEYNFGDALNVGGTPTGTNDIWIQFAHQWGSGYVDTGASNQKLLLLNSHNQVSPGRRRYQITFNYSQSSAAYFFEFFRWNEDTSFGGNVTPVALVPSFPRVLGRWEEFVFRIRMNTVGASDGQLDVWTKAEGDIEYTQRLNRTDINYRESSNFTPNRLIGLSNFDTITTRSGTRYWDSIYIGQQAVDIGTNDGLIVSNFASFDPDAAQIISLDVNNTLSVAASTGASVTFATETWWNGTTGVATIVPPTIADGYAGINNINLWKNAAKTVKQINIRKEIKASDLFCSNSTQMPKWLILRIYRALNVNATVDRPMLYLNHMNDGGTNPALQINDTLVLSPAQGTVRYFSLINQVPGPDYEDIDDTNIATYPAMRQPFYVRATAGVDGAGNPIIDADEYLSVEMRVNTVATADEPSGIVAYRVTRRTGQFFERGMAYNYWPPEAPAGKPQLNTSFIGDIDVMGGGYFNNANDGNAARNIKLGRRITFGFNLSPTVGRAWIGPPTGFVTG